MGRERDALPPPAVLSRLAAVVGAAAAAGGDTGTGALLAMVLGGCSCRALRILLPAARGAQEAQSGIAGEQEKKATPSRSRVSPIRFRGDSETTDQ